MFNVLLDENKYYTGCYAQLGSVGGIDILTLPPLDDDIKAKFYYYDFTNLVWILDESKYNTYLEEQSHIVPEKTTEEKIIELTTENINLKTKVMDLTNTVVMMSMM